MQRRRERDFGQNSSASCFEREQEYDYECDSLCTESESNGELRHSDRLSYDSESEIVDGIEGLDPDIDVQDSTRDLQAG